MDLKHSAVTQRAKGIIVDSWQSQANLSFFLGLQILTAFVLPSLGFGVEHCARYSNIGCSLLLISGVAIGWGRRSLFLPALIVGTFALVMRCLVWRTPTPRLSLLSDWSTLAAIVVICFVLL